MLANSFIIVFEVFTSHFVNILKLMIRINRRARLSDSFLSGCHPHFSFEVSVLYLLCCRVSLIILIIHEGNMENLLKRSWDSYGFILEFLFLFFFIFFLFRFYSLFDYLILIIFYKFINILFTCEKIIIKHRKLNKYNDPKLV